MCLAYGGINLEVIDTFARYRQHITEVGDGLNVCFLNLEFVSEKIKIKRKKLPLKLLYRESFFVMLHRGKNFRELDHSLSLTEAAIEMFLENNCMLYDTQIIPLDIVLLRSPSCPSTGFWKN